VTQTRPDRQGLSLLKCNLSAIARFSSTTGKLHVIQGLDRAATDHPHMCMCI